MSDLIDTTEMYLRTIYELGGVGLCTTDLVNARAILEGSRQTMQLLATGPDDRPLGVQIFGGVASELAGAAKEKVGDATDNQSLQGEGVADQASGKAKQAAEDVRQAGEDITR